VRRKEGRRLRNVGMETGDEAATGRNIRGGRGAFCTTAVANQENGGDSHE
jgi:hypothetical protein